jgi:hypothetical protein
MGVSEISVKSLQGNFRNLAWISNDIY